MSNLARWEPFRELISLREAMDRLFEESFVAPFGGLRREEIGNLAVDMYETDKEIIVEASLPGVKPEDLDIQIVGDVLTIRGEVKREHETKKENYIHCERVFGSFQRSLRLPVPVVAESAKAEAEHGVVTLRLPKAEQVQPKSIRVKVKK